MSHQIPGAFPTTPSSNHRTFEQKTPTASDFKFTPLSSMSGFKKQLYPNISHLQGSGNGSQQPQQDELVQSFKEKGYSNTLSTKVLSELNQRAAAKNPPLMGKTSVLSPRSSRYNTTHRTRFQKMESISNHYAASRRNQAQAQAQANAMNRETVELDKENIPSYDPNSKRKGVTDIIGATKRRKTEAGAKEVRPPLKQTLSPSKGQTNLQKILNSIPPPPKEIKETTTTTRIALKPPASIRSTSSSSPSCSSTSERKTLRESKSISHLGMARAPASSSSTLRSSSSISNLKQPSLRHTASTRTLPKSTTLSNLTKPTASSMSRSSTTNNLSQNLRSKPSREVLGKSRIPRSKSIMNDKNSKPLWR